MDNITLGAGKIIIQADYVMSIFQEAFTQVRAEKAGATGD